MIRCLLIVILVALHVFIGCPLWLSEIPAWQRALAYPFLHANLFHLAANSFALWTILNPKRKDNIECLVIGYVVSAVVMPLSFKPVIGISNLLYAVLGMRTPPLSSPWWKSAPVITFLSVTLVMALLPQIAGTTHVAAFIIGILIASARRRLQREKGNARGTVR